MSRPALAPSASLPPPPRRSLFHHHSLLLGSSSEGVHLHDIVLQYLRKRLPAQETRELHKKVVGGMAAASRARTSGLQDTGTTAKAFNGEEVDW